MKKSDKMNSIICPVCGEELREESRSMKCGKGHCFDRAKEGYINLIAGTHKKGSLIGDNRDMALSRRSFLEKGYFDILLNELISIIKDKSLPCPHILDICCGEGYYSHKIKEKVNCEMCGFDISKEMVRLAAKRKNGCEYFVANLSRIPVRDKSIDIVFHLFAPFHEKEFSRILKDKGTLITVVAGENHLFELKEILYDTPYKNDEMPPETENITPKEKRKVTGKIHLSSKEDIDALFRMTPYYYRTSDRDKEKLFSFNELDVTVDFCVFIY
ncbi:MAG: methyltransferase domain-containing protein [Clostridia bacterium]|nr:methyltransferase domain-containing protein [Clostridia bacterium]